MIWDEVGEDQFEREKVLVDIEQECLEVYRRKVDNANISRARLHQELADSEAEFTHLLLLLDERSLPGRVTFWIPLSSMLTTFCLLESYNTKEMMLRGITSTCMKTYSREMNIYINIISKLKQWNILKGRAIYSLLWIFEFSTDKSVSISVSFGLVILSTTHCW